MYSRKHSLLFYLNIHLFYFKIKVVFNAEMIYEFISDTDLDSNWLTQPFRLRKITTKNSYLGFLLLRLSVISFTQAGWVITRLNPD